MPRCLILFMPLLFLLALLITPPHAHSARPTQIKVVMDDNYPPFSFKDSSGNQQGILIDQWRLWEQKTGIKADIQAMDWGKAVAGMKNREFDVIDTLFKTEERSVWLDFTKPYAQIEVPIFFDKDIGGITDAASLKGFVVADKHGDAMISILEQSGVKSLQLYDSFEGIVQAAKEHKVNVFVMGKPPALYFLNKYGIADRFRQSAPLHVNQFYRAVKKGDRELLKIVDEGFAALSPEVLKNIDTKWYGSSLVNRFATAPVLVGFGGLCLIVLVLLALNNLLKKAVRKRTAELQRSEESLQLTSFAVAHAADAVFWIAADASILEANEAACRSLEYTREELLKLKVADVDMYYDATIWPQHWEELRQQGSMVLESKQRTKSGKIFPVEVTANFICFNDMEYNCAFVRDITDRKNAEDERLELERRLLHTQKLESLGVLSGGIAHDFNNLLQALRGNLDLALTKLPKESPANNNINQAIKAAGHAAKLTNMMLAYSGKGIFDIKPLNLTALVEENATMLDAAITKSITLEQHLDCTLPLIKADAGQLQQVIMNLITNAAEAIGDQGGKIRLSTGVKEFDQAALNGSRLEEKPVAGRYVWMKVCDSGCGMDADTLNKLFDPFFTTKFTGRGLGMSAVLGIIRAHKGAFLIESRLGIGTTIQVLFPIFEQQPAVSGSHDAEESVKAERGNHQVKILVVDDEDMIRDVSTAMLEELGFETAAASSGEEALKLFTLDGDSIDIVLLDQVMPGMDGVAVFKELRRIRPDIKVLLASGFSQQEVSERFRGLGLNGFLPKPYSIKNLTEELSQVLK